MELIIDEDPMIEITELDKLVLNCEDSFDIAKLMFKLYDKQFICTSYTKKKFYVFNGKQWELSENGFALREKISNEIFDIFTNFDDKMVLISIQNDKIISKLESIIANFKLNNSNTDEISGYKQKISKLNDHYQIFVNFRKLNIRSKLKQSPFKDRVVKEACEVFYKKDFHKQLLSEIECDNYHLHSENHGLIYLLQTRECCRCPEDRDVYKLGKTKDADVRFHRGDGYPKGSIIQLILQFNDEDTAERELLRIFNQKFIKAKLPSGELYGLEFFRGDVKEMIKTIFDFHTSLQLTI